MSLSILMMNQIIECEYYLHLRHVDS